MKVCVSSSKHRTAIISVSPPCPPYRHISVRSLCLSLWIAAFTGKRDVLLHCRPWRATNSPFSQLLPVKLSLTYAPAFHALKRDILLQLCPGQHIKSGPCAVEEKHIGLLTRLLKPKRNKREGQKLY